MKTAIKRENEEFLVISFQHVSGRKVIVNRPRTPKQWAVAHENGHKTRELRVFSHISQKCNGSYMPCKSNWNQKPWAITHKKVVVNHPRTPKLRAIAHENGHKTRERRDSGHISQT